MTDPSAAGPTPTASSPSTGAPNGGGGVSTAPGASAGLGRRPDTAHAVDPKQAAQLASTLLATAAASVAADPIADALKTILSQVDAIASTASVSSKTSAQAASAAVNSLVRQFNAYNAMLQAQQAKRSQSAQDPTRYRSTQASLFGRQRARGSTGSYNNLYQVGVRQDGYGTMTVNQAALGSAAQSDPRSVLSLVVGDGGATSGLARELQANVGSYVLSLAAAAGAGTALLSAAQVTPNSQPAAALTELYRTVAQVG